MLMKACCQKLRNFPLTSVNLFDHFHKIVQIISRDLKYIKGKWLIQFGGF